MARKRGQIIERGPNKYLVRIYTGTNEKGIPQYHNKVINGNQKAAQQYLTAKLKELDSGTFIEPTKLTLNEYLDKWIEAALKPRVRTKTFSSYTQLVDLYIRPALGENKLAKITPLAIQKVYSDMLDKGLSARTIRYTHTVLKNALKQAVKWQMIPQNPAENVDLPRQTKKEMHTLSPEEAKKFLDAAIYNRWGILFELLLVSGMRPGEALGLKWEDVDFKNNRIHVKRALSRTKEGWRLEEPKTTQSRRTIPLPAEVMQNLKEHKKNQAEEKLAAGVNYTDYGLVFACSNGEPLEERNIVNQYFKPLLKEAGLPPNIRLYDLRHTCATLLLAAGENPKVVAERLGHANITLTLDTYSHVLPDMQRQATNRLEEMLF